MAALSPDAAAGDASGSGIHLRGESATEPGPGRGPGPGLVRTQTLEVEQREVFCERYTAHHNRHCDTTTYEASQEADQAVDSEQPPPAPEASNRPMDREDVVTIRYLPLAVTLEPPEGPSRPMSAAHGTKGWPDAPSQASAELSHQAAELAPQERQQQPRPYSQSDKQTSTRGQDEFAATKHTAAAQSAKPALPPKDPAILQRHLQRRQQQERAQQQQRLASEQSTVRVVEHIRKNLTLFESDQKIYELEADTYENPASRGYLQTLLTQRRPPHQPHRVHFNHRPPVNDQYTQYRASDLVQAPQPASRHLGGASRRNLSQHQVQAHHQDSASRSTRIVADSSKTIKRGVESLNELLKRPLKFVAHQAKGLSKQVEAASAEAADKEVTPFSSPPPDRQIADEATVADYKAPATSHQTYTCSQSLYLLPAPDYTVHIATLVVKDILVAHQRARQQRISVPQDSYSSLSLGRRLKERLFASYSFRNSQNQNPSRRAKTKASSLSRLETAHGGRRSSLRGPHAESNREPNIDHSVSKVRARIKMPSGKLDKAQIVDNKDGTIKISYEPKEVGQHEVSLRYSDEPVDNSPIVFYVDAVGAAKKKITAYGQGLTHGLVGEINKFNINTGGLGSAKLSVTVDGPSKTSVNLQDNKDGTITVSYTPLQAGEYKIKVGFDGKQVVGSPFSTLITDEGRQRSHINVGRGSEHTLDCKIASNDDLKFLTALVHSPSNIEEPCGLKLMPNGQLAIVFTPREQGEHNVTVKRFGSHISGSPYKFDVLSRDIGDAKQVRLSGKNLKEGKTQQDNEIIINTKEAGFGGLSVALEGPGKSELACKEAVDATIKLVYKVDEPGNYSLTVNYADHKVPGAPFNIKVTGQGTNPQKDSLKKFRKLASVVDANTECHFSFKLPGTSAYDLSARIRSPAGKVEDASVKDKGDFVYQVSFVPKEAGLYTLSIRNKGIHTAGSPFPFTVGPMTEMGAHRVRCGGPGLIRGTCDKFNEFNVFTREAGAGELNVIVEGPAKPEFNYNDRKDGSCSVGYKVAEPGEYRISVLFNDQEVPDSPFRAFVMPQTGDVAKIELGPMPPENMIQLDKPCNLTVIMNGAKGNIEGKVKLPTGKMEDCFASPIDAENWGVRFIPRELGVHQVHIKFNKGSSHIPQSPVLIRVGKEKADPAAVVAHGPGLKEALVNHATDFTVETCDAGQALLDVNIEGPSKVSMGCAEVDEGYRVSYTPLAPGDYLITVKYNDCHISGSPFKVRAIKQPGSRTVADVGSHEVANISIATTERETKQKVDQMPKFKSDASRVYCKGSGIKKAFTGKPNTMTVNCSEAGFNMIFASFLGPTRNTIHECQVKHMGGSIYEVRYVCKDKGDAILMIKYGDEQIPGSPFRLECL